MSLILVRDAKFRKAIRDGDRVRLESATLQCEFGSIPIPSAKLKLDIITNILYNVHINQLREYYANS